MKHLYTGFFALLFGAVQAQYCTNVGPTSTVDSNVESVVLNGVVGSINFTGCPGVAGLQDLTQNINVTLNAGGSYTISVKFGTCNGNYAGAGQAWIDFDQNGNFDAYESLGTWAGTPPAPVQIWTFSVPPNSINGQTRLRVMQREAGTLPLDPCGSYPWGSVTDFGITLANGLNCNGYTGDDTADPIFITALPYTDTRSTSICYSNQNYVYPSADIYYRFEPNPLLHTVHASLCGSTFDTFLSVIDLNGNVIAFNDDAVECAPQSDLTFDPSGLGTLYFVVEGWGALTGDYILNIDATYVGLEEHELTVFSVWPNPGNELHIQGPEGEYRVQDMQGKVCARVQNTTNQAITLSELQPGMYFIVSETTQQLVKWEKY
ncbi:MAG: hypothetical protein RLZZ301_1455 [Bacteroidota bacterium]|jgi:hypothetical protein